MFIVGRSDLLHDWGVLNCFTASWAVCFIPKKNIYFGFNRLKQMKITKQTYLNARLFILAILTIGDYENKNPAGETIELEREEGWHFLWPTTRTANHEPWAVVRAFCCCPVWYLRVCSKDRNCFHMFSPQLVFVNSTCSVPQWGWSAWGSKWHKLSIGWYRLVWFAVSVAPAYILSKNSSPPVHLNMAYGVSVLRGPLSVMKCHKGLVVRLNSQDDPWLLCSFSNFVGYSKPCFSSRGSQRVKTARVGFKMWRCCEHRHLSNVQNPCDIPWY